MVKKKIVGKPNNANISTKFVVEGIPFEVVCDKLVLEGFPMRL